MLSMAAASVEAAPGSMDAAMESASNAALAPEGVTVRDIAMTKAAEGAGMDTRNCLRRGGSMKCVVPTKTAARPRVESRSTRMNAVAVHDGAAVRYVGVVVVDDPPAVVPIESPVVPTPAEAAEGPDAKAEPETDSRAIQVESGIGIPTGEHRQGSPVSHPRIILRHIDNVSLRRFDDDRSPLRFYLLLRRGVQISSLLGAVAHGLNRLTQFLLLVDIRVAQLGGPGEVAAHVGEDRSELGQSLDARVPRLFVYFLGQLLSLQILMLPHPLRCFQHLVRISRGRQNLSN